MALTLNFNPTSTPGCNGGAITSDGPVLIAQTSMDQTTNKNNPVQFENVYINNGAVNSSITSDAGGSVFTVNQNGFYHIIYMGKVKVRPKSSVTIAFWSAATSQECRDLYTLVVDVPPFTLSSGSDTQISYPTLSASVVPLYAATTISGMTVGQSIMVRVWNGTPTVPSTNNGEITVEEGSRLMLVRAGMSALTSNVITSDSLLM